MVEKHASKVKRDVARQVSRLQSDRRVLRAQAEPLNTRRWLSKDILDEIIGMTREDWGRERTGEAINNSGTRKPLGEEESSVRLWTLKLILAELGLSAEKVEEVLRVLVDSDTAVGMSKDAVWGLDEALEWLALYCGKEELEDYDSRPQKAALKAENYTPVELPSDKADLSSTSTPANSAKEVGPKQMILDSADMI